MTLLKGLLKDEPIRTYNDFWTWFVKHEKTFFKVIKSQQNIEKNFFNKLSPKLSELKDGFWYLTGMLNENTAELILTADGIIKNIVFVEELVAAAPVIPGWKITALKPALDIDHIAIKMDGYLSGRDTLTFYSNEDPKYPDEIDITIVHKDYKEKDKASITNGVFLFLDNYLGELNSVSSIDNVEVIGKDQAKRELVPIEKLKDFLDWREKEFVEKYQGVINNTQDMSHSIFEAETEDGRRAIAVINTDILNWESKAAYQWMLIIEIPYDGSKNSGLPAGDVNESLALLETKICGHLKEEEGYILIGHESADSIRSIYFACKEFRRPSKVIHQLSLDEPTWKLDYKIYKDKYWRSLNKFNPAE